MSISFTSEMYQVRKIRNSSFYIYQFAIHISVVQLLCKNCFENRG